MPMLALRKRRLQSLPYDELLKTWDDLARFLALQVDPATGRLPARYQELFDLIRDEFARRGTQLSLFTDY